MAVFSNKKFRSSKEANTIASRYRSQLSRHPFLLFGFPFIATMVAGSFFLTPATAIRYEKHDRRVRRLSKEEELGIGKGGRRVDMKEEYYVGLANLFVRRISNRIPTATGSQRPGRLGTETCEKTSWRTRRCNLAAAHYFTPRKCPCQFPESSNTTLLVSGARFYILVLDKDTGYTRHIVKPNFTP
jgi:cytochrome c oxidase assembly protein subunit 16